MPLINGEWRDFFPYQTRQFIFSHHEPIAGLPYTVIPDTAVRRILDRFVRGVTEHRCWAVGRQRRGATRIIFRDAAGEKHGIAGNRFALLLRDDEPIPPGRTANHIPGCPHRWCVRPDHVYRGTQSENMLDAYAVGRRDRPAAVHFSWSAEAHERLLRDRAERAAQPMPPSRFLCDAVSVEFPA